MKIGIPKEIKDQENRVAITPGHVSNLVREGHIVVVERRAGRGAGFNDADYITAGAEVVADPSQVWNTDMILKVKEPQPSEYKYFRKGQIIMTYLHLAADLELTQALMESGTRAIAYETMELNGKLPLLTPMSEVAGSYAVQAGSQFLEQQYGGKGIILGAVPGVERGKVVIIGGGVVGLNAAKIALGMGARVVILDINPARLADLENIFGSQIETLISNPFNIGNQVKDADIVIGSVLIPGRKAPVLVTEEMVKSMEPGSVIIDIAIDQGGNFETSDRATTHEDPVYTKHGVIHYAVANVPGAVPRTSTLALTNATMPYVTEIARLGYEEAVRSNSTIRTGVNVMDGKLTSLDVAESLDLEYTDLGELMDLGE